MVLARRPAARFFVAFYRWSRSNQPLSDRHNGLRRPTRAGARNYHATPYLDQQEQPPPPPQHVETDAVGQTSDLPVAGMSVAADGETTTAPLDDLDTGAQRLRNQVRSLMRKVPSSVAVVTVASYDPELNKNVPMGVAVSSLSTVTLDPPTLSFNIKQPSKTLDAIRAAAGLFRVHFLAADRGGANIVELFCRGNHPDAYKLRLKDTKLYLPAHNATWDKRASASRAPQIWSDSVRAAMECTLTHELPVADHVILVARIDSLESKMQHEPTILYHDGSYMRPDGTNVTSHGKPKAVQAGEGTWSVWDYPLFLGEWERLDYMARVKAIIKENPRYLTQTAKETLRELEANLPLSPSAFGINLEQLIDQCRRESGALSELPAQLKHSPVLSDFYGRLTPSDRAKIIDRARNLLKEDARFLHLNYRIFLQHLSVSPSSKDLLPSDFLEPLRADGLVGPFRSRTGTFSVNSRDYDLQYLEQVEHRLREHLAAIGYTGAMSSRLDAIMESFGEQKSVATYFKKSRARLHSEASPQLFYASKVDIAGEVTQDVARVVIDRVVRFLETDNQLVFRKNVNLDYNETLRLVGVHPSISGMDVEFFFGKLKHLYYSARRFRDVAERVEKMLEPYFASTITWASLEERVKNFVQKLPMCAMSWSNRDKLASMGLHWQATISVPISTDKQPLNKGHILDMLVAKELKNLYGTSTEDVSQAIARYLKERYNFNVQPRLIPQSPAEAARRSSGDDMEEAMIANRNVDVLGSKMSQARPERTEQRSRGPRVRFLGRQSAVVRRAQR